MRYILLLLIVLGGTGCSDTVSPTTDLSEAKKWFAGRWNLTDISAMVINPTIPNVQLIVSGSQIIVTQDGRQTDQVNFEIVQIAGELRLKTNAQPREDNLYIRDPALRISKNRMLLDTGMASDGPGFTFERIK